MRLEDAYGFQPGDRVTYNEAGATVRYIYAEPVAEIRLDNGTTVVTRASNLAPETRRVKVSWRGDPCRRRHRPLPCCLRR